MPNRLLFIVNQDKYFISHRLHLAKLAMENGFEVGLICNVSKYRDVIESAGIQLFDWKMFRGLAAPWHESRAIYRLFRFIKHFSPNIIHVVTLKAVIYSAFIAKFQSFQSVYALGGLGFVFTSNSLKARILRLATSNLLRLLINDKKSRVILQNPENVHLLVTHKIADKSRIRLIRGAGVDIDYFVPSGNKTNMPLVILPVRMLWNKGIREFVACAKTINRQTKKAKFALVGDIDKSNPEAATKAQLEKLNRDGVIEWWGHQENMLKVYQQADIVCFPSYYGEGLPKSLLESASCALPIVAFDVPGCREIVIDGINGFLVEAKNQKKLTDSVKKLLDDRNLRKNFGKAGRKLVLENFSQNQVGKETLQVWREVLN